MKEEKLVSVIIPVYNRQDYIEDCIKSIQKQDYKNIEIICVDDNSVDESVRIIKELASDDDRIKLLRKTENKGVSDSRNIGIKNANGYYIAFQDDDDMSMPNRIREEVDYLERHSDIDVVSTYKIDIDETGKVIKRYKNRIEMQSDSVRIALAFLNPIILSSTLVRKEVITKNRVRFRDDCNGFEDYCFWADLALYGNIVVLPKELIYYRKHMLNGSAHRKSVANRKKVYNKMHYKLWKKIAPELSDRSVKYLLKITGGEGAKVKWYIGGILSIQELEKLEMRKAAMIYTIILWKSDIIRRLGH